MSLHTGFRRFAVALAVGALAATAFPATAAADPAADGAAGAAAWLAGRAAADGGFGDPGTTADAVFGLVAADAGAGHTAAALDFLSDPAVLAPYIGTAETGYRAPQTAKIMLAVQAGGGDVNDFGGVDLEAALRGLEGPDGRFPGVLAQQFAVLVLARDDQGVSGAAVSALVSMQCDDGGYNWSTTGGGCTGDVDFTAYASAGLLAAGETTASADALDWLESVQGDTGGFSAGFPGAPENANSTGLAAGVLADGGRDDAAAKAVAFVLGLQQGCDAPEADRGAINYDSGDFNPGPAVMATAQALTGITGEGLVGLDHSDDTDALPGLDCDGPSEPGESPAPEEPGTSPSARPDESVLPVTGGSWGLPLMLGAALVVVGVVLAALTRRTGRGER
ncbi:hypothetical protein LX16_0958 [Stackebrandtia albiflava]|uniref:Prenyltransferase/squalene oxidase-like repeat protein n=1 Tax=Stackebrandtia albiflava TaxID=406432 RepID=A0A562VBM1_9ACTN|nr:prenyltransferase/squalene oxidase repeat-containing protein [Stackebrandtia albiflava]TWJ15258.1 hypothetical protein LX16_0958 [Stackebrandtia albiflava]